MSPGCSLLGLDFAAPGKQAAADTGTPSIADVTKGCERRDGLLTTYLDAKRGRVWLELPAVVDAGGEVGRFLYVEGLLTGLGSNDVGLDRGQIGPTRVVAFRVLGNKLLVTQPNLGARALTHSAAEAAAVRQSFATSILWAGEIAARDREGRTLVDFTTFVVRDAHGTAARLKNTGQGVFKLDAKRSVLDAARCLAFPDNLEFEAVLTFGSDEPGRYVRDVAPTAGAVTLTQHHSLIRLPDDGYRPRRFDPRAPSYPITFADYAAPLDQPLTKRWIQRHRLEKVDPAAARSPAREPIVYYVDPGAPEPVQSALIEGASWWNQAFDAAGFEDAFRVEVLPEGAHPLDARYNVIQWVHRATRGWSYGGSVTDPRTGEIIKGHVSLGSLRVRQDRLIFEGLLGTAKTGSGDADDPVELALARIRQLSAHEVGHTLGFSHNFAASTFGGRASVMDYPAPLVNVTNRGTLDVSSAYAVGIGVWDKFAVRYAYSQFAEGADENAALAAMVSESIEAGMVFLSDADARPPGAAHPLANLWDNGADPIAALEQTIRVREIALHNFGERNIAAGRPLAELQEVFATVYLHHRYQLEAVLKTIGGIDYAYQLRDDGQDMPKPVDSRRQRRALSVALRCLTPEFLDIRDNVLTLLAPRPFGHRGNREMFRGKTDPVFDGLGAGATAANIVVAGILNAERAARLVDQKRRNGDAMGLAEVLDTLVERVFARRPLDPREAELRRATQHVLVTRMIELGSNEKASSGARARVEASLNDVRILLAPGGARPTPEERRNQFLAGIIRRHQERPQHQAPLPTGPSEPPPGSPIGSSAIETGRCGQGG